METPVLVILFNRPDCLHKIIQVLKIVKAKHIYFKIDGPREKNKLDKLLIIKCLKLIKKINWNTKIHINKSKKNLGSKTNPVSGIDWFFTNEKMGIILEDDCIPNVHFFKFCEILLEKFKNNKKISMISGRNNIGKTNHKFSYYYTFGNTWGWATWKRAWSLNDVNLKNWNNKEKQNNFKHNLKKFPFFYDMLKKRCQDIYDKKNNSIWDYQWFFSSISNNMLGVSSSVNLVRNVGFRPDATHTLSDSNVYLEKLKTFHVSFPLKHNNSIKLEENLLNKEYKIAYSYLLKNKIKKNLYALFKKFFKKKN
jgi:hypothetical protein